MLAIILYIVIAIVILFAAAPLELTQNLLNSVIVSVNVIMSILSGIVNAFIQLLLGVVYGIINFVVGGIYSVIDGALGGVLADWVNLVAPTDTWTFQLGQLDFSAYFDTGLSPIGIFVNTLIHDVFWSNVIGGIGMLVLTLVLIWLALKFRK